MKRPLQNTLALILGDAGSRLIGFLITVYLARLLEPSAFGIISIGLAVLGYLLLAASPGIQTLETRNVAAHPGIDDRRVGAVLTLRLMLALFLWVGTWIAVTMFVRDQSIQDIVLLYSLALVPLALALDWFFQGKEDLLLVGASRVIHAIVYGLLVFAMVTSSGDIMATPVAFVAGHSVAVLALLVVYTRRYGWPKWEWSPALWRDILKSNLPVGLASFLAQNVANLPPLVIGIVLTTADVGVYSAAFRLAFVFLMADRVLSTLFLPAVARNWSANPEEVPKLVRATWKVIVFLAVPLAGAGVALAVPVVEIVFGSAYRAAAEVMMVLMGYVVLTLLNSVLVNTLIGSSQERVYVKIMVISTVALASSVVALTMVAGVMGAAAGIVVGELIGFIMYLRATGKLTGVPLAGLLLRPAIAGSAMLLALYTLNEFHPVVVAMVACGGFIVIMLATGGIGREEVRFVKERFV